MPTYPAFPSLSRQPVFDNATKYEDGTLSDPMESGYVATRPRFTRIRRTFTVSYRYLNTADIQALDTFITSTVMGMAGAFTMPPAMPTQNPDDDLTVRFTKLPTPKDAGWVCDDFAYDLSFEVTEL